MRAIVAIVGKDLRLLVRDRVALFWSFAFPLLFALVFGAVMRGPEGKDPRLPLAYTDEDRSPASEALASRLQASRALSLRAMTPDEARRAVTSGDAVAFVRVPAGFGADGPATAPVELGLDPSHRAEGAVVLGLVGDAISSPRTGPPRIAVATVTGAMRASGFELAFPAAVLWGLIGCAGSFATSLVTERRSGTWVRLLSSPVGALHVLLAKTLASLVTCTVMALVLLVLARVGFGVRVERPLLTLAAVLAASACFSGITVALGSLGKNEQSVGGAGWATLLLLAMFGGGMVPLMAMPRWMQLLGQASPVRWGIAALEGATFRAVPAADLAPLLALLVSTGGAAFLTGVALSRRLSRS